MKNIFIQIETKMNPPIQTQIMSAAEFDEFFTTEIQVYDNPNSSLTGVDYEAFIASYTE